MKKKLSDGDVRVIKISRDALFEFIREKFIDDQDAFFDVDSSTVTSHFDMDTESGQFICCVHKTENENGEVINFSNDIDLHKLLGTLPDTTDTLFDTDRYKDYTKEELIELSKG
ncbi:MAG: hypothetical protein IJD79_07625 [Clostridia bacterium]|nr:hypothetical protein [Clostridia bacterium]